jgi:hypothetical protein
MLDEEYIDDDDNWDGEEFSEEQFGQDPELEELLNSAYETNPDESQFRDEIDEALPVHAMVNSPLLDAYKKRLGTIAGRLNIKWENLSYIEDLMKSFSTAFQGLPTGLGEAVLDVTEHCIENTPVDKFNRVKVAVESTLEVICCEPLQDAGIIKKFGNAIKPIKNINTIALMGHAFVQAADNIAKAKDDPEFDRNLEAFVWYAQKAHKQNELKAVFNQMTTSSYFTDLCFELKKHRENPVTVPAHIDKLFETATADERKSYMALITNAPSAVKLPKEKFLLYAKNDDFSFEILNMAGLRPTRDKVLYFDAAYNATSYFAMQIAGNNILNVLYSKSGKDRKKWRRYINSVLLPIAKRISPDASRTPKWIGTLGKRIKDSEKSPIAVSNQFFHEISEKEKEAEYRTKYSGFVRHIKKCGPVVKGPLTTSDYILGLNSDLLDALEVHVGKKVDILTAMGKRLSSVNKAYQDSGLPAATVVHLLDQSTSLSDICLFGDTVPGKQKVEMKEIEAKGMHETLLWITKNELDPNLVSYANGIPENLTSTFDAVVKAKCDPCEYYNTLTDSQKADLKVLASHPKFERIVDVVSRETLVYFNAIKESSDVTAEGLLKINRKNVDFKRLHEFNTFLHTTYTACQSGSLEAVAKLLLDAPSLDVAKTYPGLIKTLAQHTENDRDYRKIPAIIRKSSAEEIELYNGYGLVSYGDSFNPDTISLDKYIAIVKESATQMANVGGLKEKQDEFIDNVKSCTRLYANHDQVTADDIGPIARATVRATVAESKFLQELQATYHVRVFDDVHIDKLHRIPNIKDKIDNMKSFVHAMQKYPVNVLFDYITNNSAETIEAAWSRVSQDSAAPGSVHRYMLEARDTDLRICYESLPGPYMTNYFMIGARTKHVDKLKTLSTSDITLVLQAYDFTKAPLEQDSFMVGLDANLARGTTSMWAKAIVKNFMEASKGGRHYRILTGDTCVA